MAAPQFIRVTGKLYQKVADTSPYTDTIKETEGRDCNCHGSKISVQPGEKEIASAELAMQGFETQICPELNAVCADEPPKQPADEPRARTIGGDTITSHLRRNWPSEALKPYNGSTMPKTVKYHGQVYKQAAPTTIQLANELKAVCDPAISMLLNASQPGDDKLYALQAAIKNLGDAVRNVFLKEDEQFPR